MKVYFEASGGELGGDKYTRIFVTAYVSPTKDGHDYHFTSKGERSQFSWVHPKDARVFDSKDLPRDLLYSFKHGVWRFDLPGDKADNWTPEDLIYEKVDRKRLAPLRRVQKALTDVKTLEEFWKLYPLIKKCGYISGDMIETLFRLIGIQRTPMYNGELGLAWMQDVEMFQFFCAHFCDRPLEDIQEIIQQARAQKL